MNQSILVARNIRDVQAGKLGNGPVQLDRVALFQGTDEKMGIDDEKLWKTGLNWFI